MPVVITVKRVRYFSIIALTTSCIWGLRQAYESTEASALANFSHIFHLWLWFGFGLALAKILKFAEVSAEVYVSFLKIKLMLKIDKVLLS